MNSSVNTIDRPTLDLLIYNPRTKMIAVAADPDALLPWLVISGPYRGQWLSRYELTDDWVVAGSIAGFFDRVRALVSRVAA